MARLRSRRRSCCGAARQPRSPIPPECFLGGQEETGESREPGESRRRDAHRHTVALFSLQVVVVVNVLIKFICNDRSHAESVNGE